MDGSTSKENQPGTGSVINFESRIRCSRKRWHGKVSITWLPILCKSAVEIKGNGSETLHLESLRKIGAV